MHKRKTAILILIALWIVSCFTTIIIINKYISDKDNRLHLEIRNNIYALFDGQESGNSSNIMDDGFFYSEFNGYEIKNFKRVSIPNSPLEPHFSSLWDLNWGDGDNYDDDYNYYDNSKDEGWNIVRIFCQGAEDERFFCISTIFPYRVGLKHTEWGNNYTVPDAVNNAYEFYTSNQKSSFSDRFIKGSKWQLLSKIDDCWNEYYITIRNENTKSYLDGISLPGGASAENGGHVKNGSMHNGYYEVFIACTQPSYYQIYKQEWAENWDKESLLIRWLSSESIFFWIIILTLITLNYKDSKRKNESLKKRLLRLCSPKEFLKNYDKEKVSFTNSIYQEILNTEDQDKLLELADKACSFLSISLIDKNELAQLRSIVNPAKYLTPYNAEKISLANELYDIIENTTLSYSEFISTKERAKKLLE